MIEKIRISLWDLLTFFMSGFLFTLVIGFHMYFLIGFPGLSPFEIPAPFILFVFPITFTLIGMLLEPISNLCDRAILGPIWKVINPKSQKLNKEEAESLEKTIKDILYNEHKIKVDSIYHFCKDYIEQKQANTNFMVFLARFGFYRNVAFICFFSAVGTPFVFSIGYIEWIIVTGWLFLLFLFKKRSNEFYSYLAPTVYRCFLGCQLREKIDKK
ncbi:MAG: hypothetical protein NDI81_18790 [Desulfobacula sp.]|nr:hypothetical protein [Desulfobacula sp.]